MIGWDGIIRIWRCSFGKLLFKFKGGVWNISFSFDGKRFVIVGEDGIVNIWNVFG